MIRPTHMRIDETRCLGCDLCHEVAPDVGSDRQRIPATGRALDAMADCPAGAIVWCEDTHRDPRPRAPQGEPA